MKRALYIIIIVAWLVGMGLLVDRVYIHPRPDEKKTEETLMQAVRIFANAAVPFNLSLPEEVSYLKIRISGIDTGTLDIDGDGQQLINDILEIREDNMEGATDSLNSTAMDEYLKPEMFIQAGAPEIIAKAKSIVQAEQDALQRAKLINEWVYETVKKVPVRSVPSASDVLNTLEGDCNEHTALAIALMRTVGIPARSAVGLVYAEGTFAYHAWPEVYLGRWIAIDPTLGQFPADAAHIRLISGDLGRQMRLTTVIGNIQLEGLEYK